MANELERLVDKLRAEGLRTRERGNSNYAAIFTSIANEIVAALQQAQQPGAQAVAWEVRRTDLCANGRWEACTHDAYLDTIATGRYCGFKKGPSAEGRALYTAPPPLPEGVSEEDAKAALAAMDAVLVELTGLYGAEKLSEDHQAELLQGIRAALENFLARLAAKGGSA